MRLPLALAAALLVAACTQQAPEAKTEGDKTDVGGLDPSGGAAAPTNGSAGSEVGAAGGANQTPAQ